MVCPTGCFRSRAASCSRAWLRSGPPVPSGSGESSASRASDDRSTVFKRVVNIVEVVALVGVVVFVVELFANEPGGGSAAKSGPGYDVYVSNCARCHGQ